MCSYCLLALRSKAVIVFYSLHIDLQQPSTCGDVWAEKEYVPEETVEFYAIAFQSHYCLQAYCMHDLVFIICAFFSNNQDHHKCK